MLAAKCTVAELSDSAMMFTNLRTTLCSGCIGLIDVASKYLKMHFPFARCMGMFWWLCAILWYCRCWHTGDTTVTTYCIKPLFHSYDTELKVIIKIAHIYDYVLGLYNLFRLIGKITFLIDIEFRQLSLMCENICLYDIYWPSNSWASNFRTCLLISIIHQ